MPSIREFPQMNSRQSISKIMLNTFTQNAKLSLRNQNIVSRLPLVNGKPTALQRMVENQRRPTEKNIF
jgi:hypothetical protein